MKKGIPEFVRNANNVYRTKNFIVKQEIAIGCDSVGMSAVLSRDTFYARTTVRDMEYEAYFSRRRYTLTESDCRVRYILENISTENRAGMAG